MIVKGLDIIVLNIIIIITTTMAKKIKVAKKVEQVDKVGEVINTEKPASLDVRDNSMSNEESQVEINAVLKTSSDKISSDLKPVDAAEGTIIIVNDDSGHNPDKSAHGIITSESGIVVINGINDKSVVSSFSVPSDEKRLTGTLTSETLDQDDVKLLYSGDQFVFEPDQSGSSSLTKDTQSVNHESDAIKFTDGSQMLFK